MREEKAYQAMVYFLEERYRRLPSEGLAELLGELSLDLWADGTPGDPAVIAEWERALAHTDHAIARSGEDFSRLRKVS